jgi:hypothetical protein
MAYDYQAHNAATHIQFRLTAAQKDKLLEQAPPGLSAHQAAKWLLLKKVDRTAANHMADMAAEGKKRLT